MILVKNPFLGIAVIRIYKPKIGADGNKEYRVGIDSLPTIFKMNAKKDWLPIKHAAFIAIEISSFISALIKESYFQ